MLSTKFNLLFCFFLKLSKPRVEWLACNSITSFRRSLLNVTIIRWQDKSHIKSKRFPFNTFKILWHPLTEKAGIGSFYHHYIVNGILSVIKHKGPYDHEMLTLKNWLNPTDWTLSVIQCICFNFSQTILSFPGDSVVRNLPANAESSLSQEDPLEKEMGTYSSILAWEIPWTEEPVRLQSTGSQRVRHDWSHRHTSNFALNS